MTSRLKWAGHVERMGDGKPVESICPESGLKKEAMKTNIAMG